MKKYSLILISVFISVVALSQKPVITFEESSFDFGKVNEELGKVTHVFEFVNKGNAPLVVSRAQASCGCTTPNWTKEPIEPGKKGSITVTYNTTGRPGTFTKTITVYTNSTVEQTVLTIRGEVIPKPATESNAYPVNMGGVALKTKVVQMNNVDKGKNQVRVIDIQNASKAPLRPSVENLPPHITATIAPETLKPGEEGKITLNFDSKKCSQWGPVTDDLYLAVNDVKKVTEEFKILVIANIVEDFSKLTLDQKRKAPILEIPQRTLNAGTLKTNTKKSGKIVVSNKGQNSLEIRRIINNNKELSVKPAKYSVASGKSTEIYVTVDTKGLVVGDYKKSITLQTNDPDNSFVILIVSWKVQ